MRAPVHIGFDVDDTLIDYRGRLRVHTREVFADLAAVGFRVFVWSAAGTRWEVVDVHGLRPHVVGVYRKPVSRHRERLAEHGVPFVPDFVVDDDAEIVEAFSGYHMIPPAHDLVGDGQMLLARDAIFRRFGLA